MGTGEKKWYLKLFDKKERFAKTKKDAKAILEENKEKANEMIELAKKSVRDKQLNDADVPSSLYIGDKNSEVYLYDFLQEYNNAGSFTFGSSDGDSMDGGEMALAVPQPATEGGFPSRTVAIDSNIEKKQPRKKIKPIDVWKEMETIPNGVDIKDIDDKVLVLNMKIKFIRNNNFAKKEVIDMITRLENRKKYDAHKEYFEQFDNTTTDKIQALVNKYDLVLRTSDLFIPKFPKEAMIIMTEFDRRVVEICGKKPIFYVVAEKAMFREEEKRND
ncbi:MAG: hypothetical protein AABY22_33755, partial [Nanoarchaeota archaeon]